MDRPQSHSEWFYQLPVEFCSFSVLDDLPIDTVTLCTELKRFTTTQSNFALKLDDRP